MSMKEVVRAFVTLTVVCVVIALLMSGVNAMTVDTISQMQVQIADEARRELLPDADGFDVTEDGLAEGVLDVARAQNDAGYVIKTTAKGYGGDIVMMTAFDAEGKIVACKVLSSSETPGLGKRVEEQAFLQQFAGHDAPVAVGKEITKVTSASIYSKAATSCVNLAIEAYAAVKEG